MRLEVVLEVGSELGADGLGGHAWSEAGHDGARSVNEELLEVPSDGVGIGFARLFVAEPFVEIAGPLAVHLDLGEHRKRDAVVRGGVLKNLGVGAGLLAGELVTGKAEDGETGGGVGIVERTQTCVLRGKASFTGDVDDETHVTVERRKWYRLTGDRGHRHFRKGRHHAEPTR